ncbi:MAG: hypothetical protein ACFCU3_06080 [Verrucomicrobiales bacterium]
MGGIAVLGLLLFLGWHFAQDIGEPYRNTPALNPDTYLENANSLRGNTYKFRGMVDNQLAWSPDGTRLFSVEVEEALLPVMVPPELRATGVQRRQQYFFEVEVTRSGLLNTISMTKA